MSVCLKTLFVASLLDCGKIQKMQWFDVERGKT